VWRTQVNGQNLHFRLQGVNNQNFIMQDEETGTWWQQVTGEAIHGPLKGERLEPMPFEIIGFEIWRQENPNGRVLAVEDNRLADYASADWVEGLQSDFAVPEQLIPDGDLGPRDLVVGIKIDDRAKAYSLATLQKQTPITDNVGPTPILLAVAADGKSVRAFDRRLDGETLELYAVAGASPPAFFDAGSGSEFDFRGVGRSGPLEGRQLERVDVLTEFWFDWHEYNKQTAVYRGGSLGR
jgi:hypothetical protein